MATNAFEAIDKMLTNIGYINNAPEFGDPEWINKVKQNERRDLLLDRMTAVLDEFESIGPYELGSAIHTAVEVFYMNTDVNDVPDFIRGVSGK